MSVGKNLFGEKHDSFHLEGGRHINYNFLLFINKIGTSHITYNLKYKTKKRLNSKVLLL